MSIYQSSRANRIQLRRIRNRNGFGVNYQPEVCIEVDTKAMLHQMDEEYLRRKCILKQLGLEQ